MFLKLPKENVLRNTYKVHPKLSWYIYDGVKYYNRNNPILGNFANWVNQYETDALRPDDRPESLDELNVDRNSPAHTLTNPTLIYPFFVNKGNDYFLQNISLPNSYQYAIGDTVSGSYPLLSNIALQMYPSTDTTRLRIKALKNIFNKYKIYNHNFDFNNIEHENVRLISIPEIFYGSKIEPGSVTLNFYAGAARILIGTLTDTNSDGILYQTYTIGAANTTPAGYVLYDEGFILLTGDWDITANVAYDDRYQAELIFPFDTHPKWWYFGAQFYSPTVDNSFSEIFMKGTQEVNNITMMLECDSLNYSNNPSYLTGVRNVEINTDGFYEDTNDVEVCNTVYSQFETDAPFKPQVFISKIGIYDDERKLIGVTKLSQPVKMSIGKRVMFKLSLDI
jgi:hypothetical protein